MDRRADRRTATMVARVATVVVAAALVAGGTATGTAAASTAAAGVAAGSAGSAPTLRELAARRGLLVGTAVDSAATLGGDPTYAAVLAREHGAGVSENAMKWGPIHPRPGVYEFADADAQVAFLEANGMAVRGHNLAWWNQNPAWLDDGTWTRDQLIEVLREHIFTVVGRYQGRVAQWDVVNEAIGTDLQPWPNVWQRVIGFPDYLDLAFRFAHEADPAAKLYYNDFLLEAPSPRFDAVLGLVQGMQARGVPIDGIGMQAHLGQETCAAACTNRLLTNMVRVAGLGLDVAVTELDVALPLPASPQALADQASVYQSVLQACLLAPTCHTFVTWGFTDRYSWIPGYRPGFGAALPFDEEYRAKPAYDALVATLLSPPVAPSCAGFATRAEAQGAFDAGVLGAPLLDPDGDGIACEDLPAPAAAPGVPVGSASVPLTPAFTG
ncbi:MAG: endo-1,4-beta-xylanase [Acidimicrobiales bacterium]